MNTDTKKINPFSAVMSVLRALGEDNSPNISELSEKDIQEILKNDPKGKELVKTYNVVDDSYIKKSVEEYVNKSKKIKKDMIEEKLNIGSITNSNSYKAMEKYKKSQENKDENEISR